MNRYEEGMKLIEESCGNKKDNAIALSTIATEPSADGFPRPSVRDVSAYYEDGVFYVTTSAKSNKMRQIAHNKEVAFSVCFEGDIRTWNWRKPRMGFGSPKRCSKNETP